MYIFISILFTQVQPSLNFIQIHDELVLLNHSSIFQSSVVDVNAFFFIISLNSHRITSWPVYIWKNKRDYERLSRLNNQTNRRQISNFINFESYVFKIPVLNCIQSSTSSISVRPCRCYQFNVIINVTASASFVIKGKTDNKIMEERCFLDLTERRSELKAVQSQINLKTQKSIIACGCWMWWKVQKGTIIGAIWNNSVES